VEENGGTAVVEDVPADELQSDLADLEELVRTSQG
jgi:hypothetical protein